MSNAWPQGNGHLTTADHTPSNVGRVTLACILAQISVGYASTIYGVAPLEISAPIYSVYAGVLYTVIVNAYLFGAIFAAALILLFGDLLGRKKTVACGVSIVGVATILQASSFGPAQVRNALDTLHDWSYSASATPWTHSLTRSRSSLPVVHLAVLGARSRSSLRLFGKSRFLQLIEEAKQYSSS